METTPTPVATTSVFNWKYVAIALAITLGIFLVINTKSPNTQNHGSFTGKWVCRETVVPSPGIFDSKGEAMVVERQIFLNPDSSSSYIKTANGRPETSLSSLWTIAGDYLVISFEMAAKGLPNRNQFLAFRVVRISSERMVLLYDDGTERIFDRVQ
jgi:hypothetical protein